MVCEHLRDLHDALVASGATETYRGAAWTRDCREWVCFDVVLDLAALAERFAFASCVVVHENLDPKSGTERGFYCTTCHDAIMGRLSGAPTFP